MKIKVGGIYFNRVNRMVKIRRNSRISNILPLKLYPFADINNCIAYTKKGEYSINNEIEYSEDLVRKATTLHLLFYGSP